MIAAVIVAAGRRPCEGEDVSFLSTAVQTVLEHGSFCAVATSAPTGPHCTPLVFAYSSGRLWLTTSRRSVKTRAWKVDPEAERGPDVVDSPVLRHHPT